MSKQNVQEEKGLKELFSEALKGPLDFEILGRALSSFLTDNFGFSDFNLRFDPPLELPEELFKALVLKLSGYFDGFGFTGFANHIFMVMSGSTTPENKKRLVVIYEHKNINGEILYAIEKIEGKTYKA